MRLLSFRFCMFPLEPKRYTKSTFSPFWHLELRPKPRCYIRAVSREQSFSSKLTLEPLTSQELEKLSAPSLSVQAKLQCCVPSRKRTLASFEEKFSVFSKPIFISLKPFHCIFIPNKLYYKQWRKKSPK
jgi:hypothetical protein